MIDAIEYKGYLGSLEVDFEDDCIYASVSNALGLHLTAEGTSPAEVKAAFEGLIDDYLESAESEGWDVILPTLEQRDSEGMNQPSEGQIFRVPSEKMNSAIGKIQKAEQNKTEKVIAYSYS